LPANIAGYLQVGKLCRQVLKHHLTSFKLVTEPPKRWAKQGCMEEFMSFILQERRRKKNQTPKC